MRASLDVHAGDPDQPERATLELTRALLSSFPRQRRVTLALTALAPHPGLTPTPWALDGVFEALVEGERTPVNLLTLVDADTGEALLRKVGSSSGLLGGADGRELVERPSRDRSTSLRAAGQRRPFAIPREILGSSLILCAPLVFRGHEQGRVRRWHGPLTLALAELARAWGWAPRPPKLSSGLRPREGDDEEREAAAAGLELIAASFASAAVIVDGTWAGVLEPRETTKKKIPGARPRGPDGRFIRVASASPSEPARLGGELESPDRCVALAQLGRLGIEAILGVDHWLARALGLPGRELELPTPTLGANSPGRWPQLCPPTSSRSQPTRLADRAIAGIRTQSKRLAGLSPASLSLGGAREQPALPARVPGRFAPLWTARWYGEQRELGRRDRPRASAELR